MLFCKYRNQRVQWSVQGMILQDKYICPFKLHAQGYSIVVCAYMAILIRSPQVRSPTQVWSEHIEIIARVAQVRLLTRVWTENIEVMAWGSQRASWGSTWRSVPCRGLLPNEVGWEIALLLGGKLHEHLRPNEFPGGVLHEQICKQINSVKDCCTKTFGTNEFCGGVQSTSELHIKVCDQTRFVEE